MTQRLEQNLAVTQDLRPMPELVFAPDLALLVDGERGKMSLGAGRLCVLTKTVEITAKNGQKTSFEALSSAGKTLASRIVDRVFTEYGKDINSQAFLDQTEALAQTCQPLAREIKAEFETQFEVGQLIPDLEKVSAYFEANQARFIKKGKLQLNQEGKRFSKAVSSWLKRQFPDLDIVQTEDLIQSQFSESPESRLLRRSLVGQTRWEQKETLFEILEHQSPNELFQAKYFPELGKTLAGAARFQYELGRVVKEAEYRLGRKIEVREEIERYRAELTEETLRIEAENARLVAEQAEDKPKDFLGKVKAKWNKFTHWFTKEGGWKKVAYGAAAALSIATIGYLATGSNRFERESSPQNPPEPKARVPQPRVDRERLNETLVRDGQPALGTSPVLARVEPVKPETVVTPEPPKKQEVHKGPPKPVNTPTLEPGQRQAMEKLSAQEEPLLVIRGIEHNNVDLDPDKGIFAAKCKWVELEDGQLPKPPKGEIPLYQMGNFYDQGQMVAARGEVVSYVHNFQQMLWLKEYEFQVSASLQSLQIGHEVSFGGIIFKVVDTRFVEPNAPFAAIFENTLGWLGQRVVLVGCQNPPQGELRNGKLPRVVVTLAPEG